MSKIEQKIAVDDREVTVRELTVAEVRKWVNEATDSTLPANTDVVAANIMEDLGLYDIERMTDLKVSDMEQMTPSQIQIVVDACKKVNAIFFQMCLRFGARSAGPTKQPATSSP